MDNIRSADRSRRGFANNRHPTIDFNHQLQGVANVPDFVAMHSLLAEDGRSQVEPEGGFFQCRRVIWMPDNFCITMGVRGRDTRYHEIDAQTPPADHQVIHGHYTKDYLTNLMQQASGRPVCWRYELGIRNRYFGGFGGFIAGEPHVFDDWEEVHEIYERELLWLGEPPRLEEEADADYEQEQRQMGQPHRSRIDVANEMRARIVLDRVRRFLRARGREL